MAARRRTRSEKPARDRRPRVAILMGSASDWPTMKAAADVLDELGIGHEVRVMSAHRTPDRHRDFVTRAEERGFEVIIAAAGAAAHLAGVTAALTLLPVLGVPLEGSPLQGLDALLSTVQMPGGESLKQVFRRAWEALQWSTDGLGGNDTLLVVAHDAVNRVLLCHVLGIPMSRLWTFRQAPTTLNLLEGERLDSLEVVRLNDCSHHTAFFGEAVHRAL